MAARSTAATRLPDLARSCFGHAPYPMVMVEGPTHVVRYVNPAFGPLIADAKDEAMGRPFCQVLPKDSDCLAALDRVFRTGESESRMRQEHSGADPVIPSYAMWPVMAEMRILGVMIQVTEAAPLHEKTRAMNEALVLGSLRQHELAAAANLSNALLQMEVRERKQREGDAQMLTNEVSHRVKNSLQIVAGLIGHEARRTAAECVEGYETMQARIGAIAELYDLMSQSGLGRSISVGAYLRGIAKSMSASLLGEKSGITFEVRSQPVDIAPDRALPFGLLVNELATNAIKHAFPDGTGHVVLSVERIGDQIELTVADNGVGIKEADSPKPPGKHGSDYVSIFARQLRGTIAVSGSDGAGTTVRIRLPSPVVAPETSSS